MRRSVPPRLRKPALIVLTGILFAVAWLVRGGSLWWVSIPALIAAGARAVAVPSGHLRALRAARVL